MLVSNGLTMKALILIQTTFLNSGYGRYTTSAVNEYHKFGVETRIVTHEGKGRVGDEFAVLLPHSSYINFIKNIFRVRKIARDFDVVHAYDVWPYGVYGYFAVLGTKKKLFMLGIATYSIAPEKFSLKRILMNLSFGRTTRVHSVSAYTEMRIKERSPMAKSEVVHFGRTQLNDVDNATIQEVKKRYGVTSVTGPIILTVGEIKHRKGQLDTARAVIRLKKEYPNIRYHIVGGNRGVEYIAKINAMAEENGISENIRIISDAKDEKTLIALYKMADVFCLNSNNQGDHFEGFGLVFFEAGQFGVPSIGSRGCGIEDAIQDGYSGYLTKQGDSEDIAEKILMILKGDREKFGRQVKEWANSFTWENAVKKYTREYNA